MNQALTKKMPLGALSQPGTPIPALAGPDWGKRVDGTQKGNGYFGPLKRPDGQVSTELSMGINFGHGDMEIPLLVPTLTHSEIQHLLRDGKPTDAHIDKAVEFARGRIDAGMAPWALPGETYPMPVPP